MTSDHKQKTIKGVIWSAISQFGAEIISILSTIFLARILEPHHFGLIGMVMAFAGFARVLANAGFRAALIQKGDVDQKDLSSVFWFNVGMGLIIAVVLALSARPISNFYNEAILYGITLFMALNFLIHPFNIIQQTLFAKNLEFKELAKVRIISVLIASIVAIVMAVKGYGVWSLVALTLIQTAIRSLVLWFISKWRPSFILSWARLKKMTKFSLHVFGNNSLGFLARNVDNILIGKFLGSDDLGLYTNSNKLILFPIRNVSGVLNTVLFPAFSQIQDRKQRIASYFISVNRIVLFFTLPAMLGICLLAEPIILIVLGEKWIEMKPVLQILSLMGAFASINSLSSSVFLSQGRSDMDFRLGIIRRVLVIGGIIIGLPWGIVGVALSRLISGAINTIINLFFSGKLIQIPLIQYWHIQKGNMLCSAIMVLGLIGVLRILPADFKMAPMLLLGVGSGMLIYFCSSFFLNSKAVSEIKSIINNIKQNVRSNA